MSPLPPAEGERSALRAYEAQYRVASRAVVGALRTGRFASVRMVDPAMGRVDDFVLLTPSEAHGHQVKWSEHAGTLTLPQMLVAGQDGAPSLFRQLADGWSRLRASFTPLRIRVSLIHHGILGTSTDIAGAPSTAPQRHFAAFYERVWCVDVVPTEWQPVLDTIRNHTGLTVDEFDAFRGDCRIETRIKDAEPYGSNVPIEVADDEMEVQQLLRTTVAASAAGTAVIFTRNELLRALGWQQRFQQNFQHDFPTPADYVPNQAVEELLARCLRDAESGYVALVGGPGSGKSTLLTQFLSTAGFGHVVRYYAFVPEGINDTRADASRFLHDLIAALDHSGLPARDAHDLAAQQQQLVVALTAAGDRFRSNGRRTVILVDGLDHVQRARPLTRSLLAVLPSPATFPAGVVMVVGSQRLDLDDLPDSVRAQCELSTRNVRMRALAPDESLRLMQQALGEVNASDHTLVHARTQGHPLSLRLVIDALRERPDDESVEAALDRIAMDGEDLERVYQQAWRVAQRAGCTDTLALVARLRHAFSLRDLLTWVGGASVTALREQLAYLFRPLAEHVWVFQHDSFRRFLQAITQLDPLGEVDSTQDHAWHRRLATFAAQHTGPFHDEGIYHAARCLDSAWVVAQATLPHFRAAFHRGRPQALLGSDLDEVLRSAREIDDPLAVARGLLVRGELNARVNALGEVDLLSLAYDCEGAPAVSRALHGGYAHIDLEPGMDLANRLLRDGLRDAARDVFEAAEPLALLHDLERTPDHQPDGLVHWAEMARHFRPLPAVIARLARPDADSDDHSPDRHVDRLIAFAYTAMCEGDHPAADAALNALGASSREAARDTIAWWRLEHDELPSADVVEFWTRVSTRPLDPHERALIAERLLRVAHESDAARAALTSWTPESLATAVHHDHQYQTLQMTLLRGWRVCAALDAGWEPGVNDVLSVRITDDAASDDRALPVRLRLRAIERLAKAWGAAWRGERWSVDRIVDYLQPVWRALTDARGGDQHVLALQHRTAKPILFFCLEAAAQHGLDQGVAVAEAMLAQFAHSPDLQHEWGLRVVKAARGLTSHQRRAWAHAFLETWSAGSGPESLEAWADLARTMAALADRAGAQACRLQLFARSFVMVYDKDYTPIEASTYLRHAVDDATPELARPWILRFAAALERADNAPRQAGRGYHEAWGDVVRCAGAVSPAFALAVWREGFDRRIPLEESLLGLTLALERAASPTVVLGAMIAVVAPMQGSPRRSAEALLQRIAPMLDTRSREWARQALEAFVHPSVAGSYAQALGLTARPSASPDSHERIVLAGAEITLAEFETLADDVEAMIARLNGASAQEYTWNSVLPPVIARCDERHLQDLQCVVAALQFPFQAVIAIADRWDQAGDRASAVSLIEEALLQHSDGSWTPWADGGPRLKLFRELVRYKPEARAAAWKDFVASRIGPRRYAWHATVFDVLDDVQFALQLPAALRWQLLEEYLSELSPFRLDGDGWQVSEDGMPSADDALVDALHQLLRGPTHRVSSHALLAMTHIATEHRLQSLLARHLTQHVGDDRERLQSLRALRHLQALPGWEVDLDPILRSDAGHPHLAVRQLVAELRARALERHPRALSPFYQLQTPDLAHEPHPWGDYGPTQPVSDLVDDESLVLQLLGRRVQWVASLTGISPATLVRRAVALYREAGGVARYGEAAQRKAARLRLPFVRIRMAALRDAFSRVAAELLDADRVPQEALAPLLSTFQDDDVRFALPPFARPPAGWASKLIPQRWNEEWSLDDLPLLDSSGAFVVAAFVDVHAFDRTFQYRHVAVPEGERLSGTMLVETISTTSYPHASPPREVLGVALACASGPMEPDHIVALNPRVARTLNWHLKPRVGAEWHDAAGGVMAYSTSFAQGNDLLGFGSRAIGSAVIVTAEGNAALRRRFPRGSIATTHWRNEGAQDATRDDWLDVVLSPP